MDDWSDFGFQLSQSFGSRFQTKIEPVSGTGVQLCEVLDARRNIGAIPACNALVTHRCWWVRNVVRQSALVFFGYREDAFGEVSDAFVDVANRDFSGDRMRFVLGESLLIVPSAAGRFPRAGEIVLPVLKTG
ncbi:MAG: hypothetical protein M2R45_00631 [Verrucomicrobia subdivision 3 bacterium]|nr:hypothetical protein [Limisphaerales bacterium]MCS1414486.1 hypothetical protein [Limisphaerales bacterium]